MGKVNPQVLNKMTKQQNSIKKMSVCIKWAQNDIFNLF